MWRIELAGMIAALIYGLTYVAGVSSLLHLPP